MPVDRDPLRWSIDIPDSIDTYDRKIKSLLSFAKTIITQPEKWDMNLANIV